jgi:hypothetical protein
MRDNRDHARHGAPSGPFGYCVCDGCGVAIQRRLAADHSCHPDRYAAHQASRLHWRRAGFEHAFARWLETPAGRFSKHYARRLLSRRTPQPGEA